MSAGEDDRLAKTYNMVWDGKFVELNPSLNVA